MKVLTGQRGRERHVAAVMAKLSPEADPAVWLALVRPGGVDSTYGRSSGDERGHTLLLDSFEVDPGTDNPVTSELLAALLKIEDCL